MGPGEDGWWCVGFVLEPEKVTDRHPWPCYCVNGEYGCGMPCVHPVVVVWLLCGCLVVVKCNCNGCKDGSAVPFSLGSIVYGMC